MHILLNDPEHTILNCYFDIDLQSQALHTNSLKHRVLQQNTNTKNAICIVRLCFQWVLEIQDEILCK